MQHFHVVSQSSIVFHRLYVCVFHAHLRQVSPPLRRPSSSSSSSVHSAACHRPPRHTVYMQTISSSATRNKPRPVCFIHIENVYRVVSIIRIPQRIAPVAFSVRQKRCEKVGNARACGSQRRAAGVPQAVRTVLYSFRNSASAGGVAVRCVMTETTHKSLPRLFCQDALCSKSSFSLVILQFLYMYNIHS